MDTSFLIALAVAVLVAVVTVLKVVAPKTKNTVDDKLLDYAEKGEALIEGIAKK